MNKKQTYVFLLYLIVEIYVFFLPLPTSQKAEQSLNRPLNSSWGHQQSLENSSFVNDDYPERIDIASWVSIFFFLLFIAATFYQSDKILNPKEK